MLAFSKDVSRGKGSTKVSGGNSSTKNKKDTTTGKNSGTKNSQPAAFVGTVGKYTKHAW